MTESKARTYAARIHRICDYISQHLDEDLTLDQLSQLANFSKYHFHRQFADYTGMTVYRFIQLLRLKRASYRLAFEKDDRIIDIALEAQFENPESFTRAFRNIFGQSPSQFRADPAWPTWHSKVQINLPSTEELTNMHVNIVNFKDTPVAVLEHRAPADRVMESVSKFIEWRKQSKLSPVASSNTYGIIYDDPDNTPPEKFRYDICGATEQPIPPNPQGIKSGVIPGGRCAVVRHYGGYQLIGNTVRQLYREWLPTSGEDLRDFPCFFHYLNLISQVEEYALETDIYLPLR